MQVWGGTRMLPSEIRWRCRTQLTQRRLRHDIH